MTKETLIRIGLVAVAFLTTAVLFVCDIACPLWVRIIVAFALLVTLVGVTYHNQDFCEADRLGTGKTRQIKKEQAANYIGERFYSVK